MQDFQSISNANIKIGILCVTFNRIEFLKRLLDNYRAQETDISVICVINNNSSDGTHAYLEEWKGAKDSNTERVVIHLPQNSGGAGGFHAGLQYFKDSRPDIDYVYIADDDAFPESDLFSRFIRKSSEIPESTIAACAAITTSNGIDLSHRKRIARKGWRIVESKVPLEEYSNPVFSLNLYSFVGTFLRRKVLEHNILPDKDYFISYDDTEHSFRSNALGDIMCFPDLKVFHETELFAASGPTWKVYYMRRNRLLFWKHSFSRPVVFVNFLHYAYNAVKAWGIALRNRDHFATTALLLDLAAFRDAIFECKGISSKYKPGWKPK